MSFRRGVTLIELLVAATVSLLVGTVLIVVFVFVGNALSRHSLASQAQRNVLTLMSFARDVVRSGNCNSVYCGPTWFSEASWEMPNGSMSFSTNAELLWVSWCVVYYDAATQQVRLQKIPINPATAYVSPLQLTTYTASLTDRVLATNITQMTTSLTPPSQIQISAASVVNGAQATLQTTLVPCSSQTDPDAAPTSP